MRHHPDACKHLIEMLLNVKIEQIEMHNEEVRSFFEFLISNRAENGFTSDLKDYVTDAKHNMQWRVQFMTWERQRAYDYDDGKAAGKQEKAVEAAKSFYANGVSIELIAKSLGMTCEQVEDIVNAGAAVK